MTLHSVAEYLTRAFNTPHFALTPAQTLALLAVGLPLLVVFYAAVLWIFKKVSEL